MIEVFKTGVRSEETAGAIITGLQQLFPGSIVNFDLDDCDNILRVKGLHHPPDVIAFLNRFGFECELLD